MWFRFFGIKTVAFIQKLSVIQTFVSTVEEKEKSASVHFYTRRFEAFLSSKLNTPTLGTSSGTDALIFALKALKIGFGDEVIVPAFGCVAIASCVSWIGAKPVFVDIQKNDYSIDPDRIEEKITPKTKAILVAHLFGQPSRRVKDVMRIAEKWKLFVIEDAAQSFGAKIEIDRKWRYIGTIGDIGCFSFSSTKLFATPGKAGAIITKDARLRNEISRMRFYGAKIPYYDHPDIGIHGTLDKIHAAILLAKFPFLEYWLGHRKKLSSQYTKALSQIKDISLPQEESETERVWYRYIIRTKQRNQLLKHMLTSLHSTPHLQPKVYYPVLLPELLAFHSSSIKEDFPIANQVSSEALSLPLYDTMTMRDVDIVCETIKKFFKMHSINEDK